MPTAKRKKIKKRTKYTAFGACVISLALVGVIAVIVLAVNTTVKVLDDSEQKAEFEKYLAPVVMFDPVAFESVDKASEKMLLESSLWATLMNMDSSKYIYDDMQMLVVNQTDVDASCAKLFGKDVKLNHQSFGETQMNFIYQAEDKTYHIPVMGVTNMYTPKVEKITKRAGKYILKVGYIAPDSDWTIDPAGSRPDPEPSKYMEYELKRDGKEYYITAIRKFEDGKYDKPSSSASSDLPPGENPGGVSSGAGSSETSAPASSGAPSSGAPSSSEAAA